MESLFSNLFLNADKTAWLTQVQKELMSETAYESLRWQTGEGFTLEPYYTTDSLNELPLNRIQAAQKPVAGWLNAPEYRITDEKIANTTLRAALAQGADAFILNLPVTSVNVAQLLNGIKLSDTPIFFCFASYAGMPTGRQTGQTDFVKPLQLIAPYQLKGGLLADITEVTAEATRLTANSPNFRTVYVSSHVFHNAGATVTQELAFTLSSLADLYDKLTDNGLTIDQLVPKTILSISVGTSYFLEIAKLRALRVLLSRFLSHYSLSIIHYPLFIHAQTSTFYDATVTPYTNLIRATTEAMAAVIGGCDVLTVHPYDTVLGQQSEFAHRIAQNVPLLLKEESYLGKVADPSAGSYYVENLTHQLVEATWALFLDVEKRGGLAKATDFIWQEIEQAYQKKVDAVRTGKVLVGVTKFRSDETASQIREILNDNAGAFPNRRLAEEFE